MKTIMNRLLRNFNGKSGLILLLFGIEGIFLQYAVSVNSLGNSLYATSMGATDSQIGMIQMIPNLVAVAILFPLGIISNRLKSSKTVPLIALIIMAMIAYSVNVMIPGANYLYLARPEAAPSVLDILPPNFALRTTIIAAVILLMYVLAYLPWYLKDKKAAKSAQISA